MPKLKLKLTKTAILALPHAEKGQVDYHDAELKGFMLRVGARSMTYYVLHPDQSGKRKRRKIGTTTELSPARARALARVQDKPQCVV